MLSSARFEFFGEGQQHFNRAIVIDRGCESPTLGCFLGQICSGIHAPLPPARHLGRFRDRPKGDDLLGTLGQPH
jgi:hypothetical protein